MDEFGIGTLVPAATFDDQLWFGYCYDKQSVDQPVLLMLFNDSQGPRFESQYFGMLESMAPNEDEFLRTNEPSIALTKTEVKPTIKANVSANEISGVSTASRMRNGLGLFELRTAVNGDLLVVSKFITRDEGGTEIVGPVERACYFFVHR